MEYHETTPCHAKLLVSASCRPMTGNFGHFKVYAPPGEDRAHDLEDADGQVPIQIVMPAPATDRCSQLWRGKIRHGGMM